MDKEIRSFDLTTPKENTRTVEGYALVFNSESRNLGGFREIISPNALDGLIERSDVFCYLDHNRDRGVLARSRYGNGSLTLTVDDIGLYYSFDAPNTSLGDELLEGVKRGDIANSSFAFRVEKDSFTKADDGVYVRHIDKIKELFDISPVYTPAYDATTVVCKRSYEEFIKNETMEIEERKEDETLKEVEIRKDEEQPKEEEKKEEEKKDETPKDEEVKEGEDTPKEEDNKNNEDSKEEESNINKRNYKEMGKFSLISAIRTIANGGQLDERSMELVNQGKAEMRNGGQSYNGSLVLPMMEKRDGEVGLAADIKGEDLFDLVGPLRANLVFTKAGATFLNGLVNDVKIPIYDGGNVTWEGETAAAKNGKGGFSDVKLSPKRLTAKIDVSKQFLLQDSIGAEEMLKSDIVRAISDKLEKTILGKGEGSATEPAGLLNGAEDLGAVTYTNIAKLEGELEEGNVSNLKFIVSPSAKATLKTTQKGNGVGFIMESNEVDGYPTFVTSNCEGIICGDFSDYVIAQWGGVNYQISAIVA